MKDLNDSESTRIKIELPYLVRLGVVVSIFGLVFPVYGIPLGWFKITFFRMGYLILLPLAMFYNPRLRLPTRKSSLIMRLFIMLASWRLLSLIILVVAKPYGTPKIYGTQLIWFVEGILFLLSILLIFSRFRKIMDFYLHALFYAGFASIGVMAIQFLLSRIGILWTLPLSTSAFGQSQDFIMQYGYPLPYGRVVGAFADPNMSGTMCALFFAAFFPLVIFEINARSIKRRFLVAAILVLLIAVVGTGSRQALLAILISFGAVMFIGKKRGILVTIIRLAPLILLSTFLFYSGKYYFAPDRNIITRGSLNNVLDRLEDTETGNLTIEDMIGLRLRYIQETLPYITFETLIVGMGEGMTQANPIGVTAAISSIHNAYLVTLLETSLIGLIILLSLSFVLLYFPYKVLRRKMDESRAVNMAIFCISMTWVFLLFVNWAQLNQSISYLYLALALMWLSQKSNPSFGRNWRKRAFEQKKDNGCIMPPGNGRHSYVSAAIAKL